PPRTPRRASRHRRQHDHRRRRDDGGAERRHRTRAHRPRRENRREERGAAVAGRRRIRDRSSRLRSCGLAQSVDRVSPVTCAEKASRRARTSGRRARREAGRLPDGDGSLITRRPFVVVVLLILWFGGVVPASAQQPLIAPAPPEPDFFSRSDFHLNAAWIRTVPALSPGSETLGDRRFMWDTFWGGSADIFDYVSGRVGVIIDYEAVLGGEFQPFDPNQGNYTLEASGSGRLGAQTEVVGMLHHVSRHLSDRSKV